ncbi:NADH-quinone oxidoreductase subunit L [Candidatus Pantoea edessiphila]|uniref:NADH-quinone oxidoreductase subunit L n=1 Tax=Candidatus Pantoea edessiphila TaxID=2044610 RepID=A0A2P5SYJ8_9GAMM|nr:NADH-quinone oxidoreductase subunit L [Candidatus Pantoea edessiphila]MBK4775469.1 NADH-quinone oxidoreductase subunit L [Pantoea sp. Edef]PPI87404.1 NADH-quinone oxidoreductase subunit L [Candidatus Pantoea edessiphila]
MNLIYLTIIFPLLGFLLLSFSNGYYSERISSLIGVSSIGLSGIITILVGYSFFLNNQVIYSQILWNWMHIGNFNVSIKLILDGLSLAMLSVVTGVGFLIHLFSSWYMQGKEGYSRFFAYTNLFVASMIILILADNLLLMFLGWECVGFCSYLLIGFYYSNLNNCKAAIKAFVTTRIGDVFLIIAIIMIYNTMGTINFLDISKLAISNFSINDYKIHIITMLLLLGAVGKSAQLPLQTWLPDAMVGPTPVSALIHAATMVTAGVYLIVRTHSLFLLTPEILNLVGIIGAFTLMIASFSALVQADIKRILAYSTMSQIGYMFLSLGLRAWNSAVFHLITHAFFKALLFLSAGSLITYCNHEQNIYKMGGLKKSLPFLYMCFLVGGSSLSSVPLITAGFYSKKNIIFSTLTNNNISLMSICLFGSLLTAIYTFRMIFTIFHGRKKIILKPCDHGINYYIPLFALLLLSTCIGGLFRPPLGAVFPKNNFNETGAWILEIISSILIFTGIAIAAVLFSKKYNVINKIINSYLSNFFCILWYKSWGFDWIYDKLFVKTYLLVAFLLRSDPLNTLFDYLGSFLCFINNRLLIIENGYLRWYILSMSIGALAMLIFILTS